MPPAIQFLLPNAVFSRLNSFDTCVTRSGNVSSITHFLDLQINETVHKTITRISEITSKFRRNYLIFIEKLIFLIDEALNDIVKAVRFQTA